MAAKKVAHLPQRFEQDEEDSYEEESEEESHEEGKDEEEEEGAKTPAAQLAASPQSPPSLESEEDEEAGDEGLEKSSPVKPITPKRKRSSQSHKEKKGKMSESDADKGKKEKLFTGDDDKGKMEKLGKKEKRFTDHASTSAPVSAGRDPPPVSALGSAVSAGRVWSDHDLICVLEGMIDYENQNGVDPSSGWGAFHAFIKGKLHADVNRTQLYEKIRALKMKYFRNVEKADGGKEPVFAKPFDCKVFQLSKMVWGPKAKGIDNNSNVKINNEKSNKAAEKNAVIYGVSDKIDVVKDGLQEDCGSQYPFLHHAFDESPIPMSDGLRGFLKGNLSLIGSAKAKELEEKWKKLRVEESKVYLKKSCLTNELMHLVVDALK